MGNSGLELGDEQQDSQGSWREWGRRQSELRSNPECAKLFSDIPDDWHEAAIEGDFSELDRVKALSREGLTKSNYTRTLKTLLMMEQAHESIGIRRFDMFKKRPAIRSSPDMSRSPFQKVLFDGLSRSQLNLMPGDFVVLRSFGKNLVVRTIKFIEGDIVALVGNFYSDQDLFKGESDVFFVSGGLLYTFYRRALDRFNYDSSLAFRIFQEESCASKYSLDGLHNSVDCAMSGDDGRLNEFNGPQRQAILNIVEARFWPKPYILFGPPGTGKTHTLAEAIVQVYTRKPRCQILYCANSNTCVDQMAERLARVPLISAADTCRLFAGQYPSRIGGKRIFLTTNMKSSCLMDSVQFDYVFIDEAGHAHEAESLLPICCLKQSGSLVLAGDPKQLGPVIQCQQASEYGLGETLLDRLFKYDIYKRDCTTCQYDSRYITKLLVSYRCDPRILFISNKLFYDNELQCVNETPRSLLRMMRITNPLQLRHVDGREEQPSYSSSWFNSDEVDQCVDLITRLYKMGLTPDQIGVISPYKLQTNEIKRKLNRELVSLRGYLEERFREVEQIRKKKTKSKRKSTEDLAFDLERLKLGEVEKSDLEMQDKKKEGDSESEMEWVEQVREREDRWLCKIDSVDAFQGNEREVIIISTVRTNGTRDHAFVNEPRRFNVAISRAKWLVFVIGHEDFLLRQSNWNQFIRHAGREMSRWPAQSKSDSEHPFKQSHPLFRPNDMDQELLEQL